MNKTQREWIKKFIEDLNTISKGIEGLSEHEQEKFDNLNEGMQAMEKFQKLQENADTLATAQELIEEAIGALEELEL